MAENYYNMSMSELKDLRAWRAFLVEARGNIYALGTLRFTLQMSLEDALSVCAG